MITKIITGGQTGADIAGWRAAKACGIATGGVMPPRFMTEDGGRPEYAGLYGAVALADSDYTDLFGQVAWGEAYRDRTRANAKASDACVWFGNPSTRGYYCTERSCQFANIGIYVAISREGPTDPRVPAIRDWLEDYVTCDEVRTLFVAGNRESRNRGIGEWVERYLTELFGAMISS